jgi:hypothetical protein
MSNIPYKELLFALLGAATGLVLMRLDDKFYNKQYTIAQYVKLGTGFYIACLAVMFVNKYFGQLPVINQFMATGPIPVRVNGSPVPGESKSVFTPINTVNNMRVQGGVPNF